MRPKKRVLLVSGNERWRECQTFLLETRSFAVSCAASHDQLAQASEAALFDVVVAHEPGALQDRKEYRCGTTPVVVATDGHTALQILETTHLAVKRKHGPQRRVTESVVWFAGECAA